MYIYFLRFRFLLLLCNLEVLDGLLYSTDSITYSALILTWSLCTQIDIIRCIDIAANFAFTNKSKKLTQFSKITKISPSRETMFDEVNLYFLAIKLLGKVRLTVRT